MNKEEFLSRLRKKLSILEESEIEDIISEYEGYIEEKISKGSTEKEAVASMGDVDELAKELLSAYKIKSPNDRAKDTFNTIVDGAIHVFERVIDTFAHKSFQEILRFILELIFIFVIIAICKIPFEILSGMGRSAFYALGGGAFRVLAHIWEFILEFVYLIFAVLFFIKIFESRYLEDFEGNRKPIKNASKKDEVIKKKVEDKEEQEKEPKKEKVKKERVREPRNFSVLDSLVDLCMLFIKFIAFFILIGVVFYVVGMSLTVGLSVYFLIKGVFYFGIYLILIALFLLGIIAFVGLFNFIFNHKNKVGVLLILSLICFVVLGVGVGVCAIEFANTTITYNEDEDQNATFEYTYEMKDNLLLGKTLTRETIVFDESLGNKIKFEYHYNDTYYQIEAKPHVEKNNGYEVLYYWYDVKSFVYSKHHLDDFLEHLKEKKISLSNGHVDITLKMSKSTYDTLLENEEKYQKIVDRDEVYEDVCEELSDLGYSLPKHCIYHH